jgi:hypothetical protein
MRISAEDTQGAPTRTRGPIRGVVITDALS